MGTWMKKMVYVVLLLFFILCGGVAGCSFLNKALPSQTDPVTGISIPGTHQATPLEQTAAGMVPFGLGSVALNGILLVMNALEKYKANKTDKGLRSTIIALNQIKNDPALKQDWEAIKGILSDAHNAAGIQSLINNMLAKTKSV